MATMQMAKRQASSEPGFSRKHRQPVEKGAAHVDNAGQNQTNGQDKQSGRKSHAPSALPRSQVQMEYVPPGAWLVKISNFKLKIVWRIFVLSIRHRVQVFARPRRYSRMTSSLSSVSEVSLTCLSSVMTPCWSILTRSQISSTWA